MSSAVGDVVHWDAAAFATPERIADYNGPEYAVLILNRPFNTDPLRSPFRKFWEQGVSLAGFGVLLISRL
jgi:hypothetical protein